MENVVMCGCILCVNGFATNETEEGVSMKKLFALLLALVLTIVSCACFAE